MDKPIIYEGGISIDDRGKLSFINQPISFKRLYFISNHKSHFIRSWHAHKLEEKYVTVIQGSAIISAVKIDNWDNPNKDLIPERFILSAEKPQLLWIPKGYANGFMTLSINTIILFLSTSTLEESKNDDFRYPFNYWNCWEILQR